MDIDASVRALPLTEQDISRIVSEICAIEIEERGQLSDYKCRDHPGRF